MGCNFIKDEYIKDEDHKDVYDITPLRITIGIGLEQIIEEYYNNRRILNRRILKRRMIYFTIGCIVGLSTIYILNYL
jgi:hypothetical protein